MAAKTSNPHSAIKATRSLLVSDEDSSARQSILNTHERIMGKSKIVSFDRAALTSDPTAMVEPTEAELSEDSDSEIDSVQRPQHITERRKVQNARFSAW